MRNLIGNFVDHFVNQLASVLRFCAAGYTSIKRDVANLGETINRLYTHPPIVGAGAGAVAN